MEESGKGPPTPVFLILGLLGPLGTTGEILEGVTAEVGAARSRLYLLCSPRKTHPLES